MPYFGIWVTRYWLKRKSYFTTDIFAFLYLWKLSSQTHFYSDESHPDFGTFFFYFDNYSEFLCCLKADFALEEFSTIAFLGNTDWGQVFPVTVSRSMERNIFWNLRLEKKNKEQWFRHVYDIHFQFYFWRSLKYFWLIQLFSLVFRLETAEIDWFDLF